MADTAPAPSQQQQSAPPPVSLAHRLAAREDARRELHRNANERLRRKASA